MEPESNPGNNSVRVNAELCWKEGALVEGASVSQVGNRERAASPANRDEAQAWQVAVVGVEKNCAVSVEHEMGELELHRNDVGGAIDDYRHLQRGRGQVDPSTCSNNEAVQGPEKAGGNDATNSAMVASFLRRRAPQGLAFALVAATAYVIYRRRHRRPGGRPRSRRQQSKRRSDVAVDAARKWWWQRAGGNGRKAEGKDDGVGKSGGGGGVGGVGGGGDTRGVVERADDAKSGLAQRDDEDDKSAGSGQSLGGKEGEMDGRMDVGEEANRKGTSEHDEPGPTACPSPEHHREGNDGGKTTHGGVRKDGQQQGDVSSDRANQGGEQPGYSAEEQDPALARMSRGQSLLSESSTEDILAEADHLIADAANQSFNSIRATTTPTKPRPRKTRATSKATSPTRAARSTSRDSPRGASSPKPTLTRMTSASRSSDTRSPKRPRVYPEVSGEEVDALVSLTHRALQRDPSALSEIAKDASLQQGGGN